MVIGALLVSIAYFLGNTDKTADAQRTATFNDVHIKGHLSVEGDILVVDANRKNDIGIKTSKNRAVILLRHGVHKNKKDADSIVILGAVEKDGTPFAFIDLLDKFGNELSAESYSEWSQNSR